MAGQHYPSFGEAAQTSSNYPVSGPSVDAARPYQSPSGPSSHVEESSQQQLQVPQRMVG